MSKRVAVLGCGYRGKSLVRNFHAGGALSAVCDPSKSGHLVCPESGLRYLEENGCVYCLDLGEDDDLPDELAHGKISYRDLKAVLPDHEEQRAKDLETER